MATVNDRNQPQASCRVNQLTGLSCRFQLDPKQRRHCLAALRRVGQAGSISQAARDAGISYKATRQDIDTLSNLSGKTLVDRTVGGSGGGAHTTPQQLRLLARGCAAPSLS